MYAIRDREAGNMITVVDTLEEAVALVRAYEQWDMDEGMYTVDFYEIVEWDD